jgi:hypothetical protein
VRQEFSPQINTPVPAVLAQADKRDLKKPFWMVYQEAVFI